MSHLWYSINYAFLVHSFFFNLRKPETVDCSALRYDF